MSLKTAMVYEDLSPGELLKHALNLDEGILAQNQALSVTTGKRTGRSPHDRFIVRDNVTDTTVDWGDVNRPIDEQVFTRLWEKTEGYLAERDIYCSHLQVGADPDYAMPVSVYTEYAWHNLFAQYLFIRPEEAIDYKYPRWTILSAPSLHTDPAVDQVNSDGVVIIDFAQHKILIMGIAYAGEMKKAMFTAMNYYMPEFDVLPMHCAANEGVDKDVSIFFGLSGTGKTTLSSDPDRFIIGDDEHGWSKTNVFNFEGGCYAKCINLSAKDEPVIYKAVSCGAVMENVVLEPKTLKPDYSDGSLTQNTRGAYPRDHIEKRVLSNQGAVPNAVIFLTCDLYGVIPPVAILDKHQAAYHFLSGYTAKVGGTELGVSGVQTAFSVCFGAPFFPRPAEVYGKLLIKRIEESGAKVYLVNTGWTGGAYGEGGERFRIPVTRQIIHAIQSGEVAAAPQQTLAGFDFVVPTELAGVDANLLNPEKSWADPQAYQAKLKHLMELFAQNICSFKLPEDIVNAGPH